MPVSGSSSHIRQRVESASQSNLIFPVHEVQLSYRELNHQFSRTDGKTKRSSKNIHEKLICCIRNSLVTYRFGVRAKSCAFWTRPDCPKALVHRQKERPHTAPHAQCFYQIRLKKMGVLSRMATFAAEPFLRCTLISIFERYIGDHLLY